MDGGVQATGQSTVDQRKDAIMAKNETAPAKEKRERKPARTIEEQIADLKAKAELRAARQVSKAERTIKDVESKIAVAEAKLGDLYAALSAAQAELGIDTSAADEAVETYSPTPAE